MDAGLDVVKTASKKVVQKVGELLGNKIADAVTKPSHSKIVKVGENLRNVEEVIIPPEKKEMKY